MNVENLINLIATKPTELDIVKLVETYKNVVKKNPNFNSNNGILSYKTFRKINGVKQTINGEELSTFFNRDLVLEYLGAHNVDFNTYANNSEQIKSILDKVIMEVKGLIIGNNGKIVLDSAALLNRTDDVYEHEFVLNVSGGNVGVVLVNLYNNLKNANIPFHVEINNFNELGSNFNDAIKISCSSSNLANTLNCLLSLQNIIGSMVNFPGSGYANINNWIGYTSFCNIKSNVEKNSMLEIVGKVIYNSIVELCKQEATVDATLNQTLSNNANLTDINYVSIYENITLKNPNYYQSLIALVQQKINSIGSLYIENNLLTKISSMYKPIDIVNNSENIAPSPQVNQGEVVSTESSSSQVVPAEEVLIPQDSTPLPQEAIPLEGVQFDANQQQVVPTTPDVTDEIYAQLDDQQISVAQNENVSNNIQDIFSPAEIKPLEDPSKFEDAVVDSLVDELQKNTALNNVDELQKNTALNNMVIPPEQRENIIKKYSVVTNDFNLLSQMVSSPNGNMTVLDYLESNQVLEKIPFDATVYMADGTYLSGADFINLYVIQYIVNNGVIPVEEILQKYTNDVNKNAEAGLKKGLFDFMKKRS